MSGNQNRRVVLSGALLCALALGFSDTARAQTVTITSGGQPLSGPLSFTVAAGAVSAAQTLTITTPPNNGNTIVTQVPPAYASWLNVSPSVIGSTPGQLTVSVNATSLSAGTHAGNFTVAIQNNPASAQTIIVNANITGGSALSASPSALSFTAQAGSNFGTPQNCTVQNNSSTCQVTILSSAGPLAYNVTTSPANSWLLVDQFSGSTNGIPMNIGVNATTLTPGPYTGQVLVQSKTTGDSVTIAVSLTVTANATLTAAPMQLNFFYTTGTANPPAQQVTVSSNGSAQAFTVDQSPGSSWLHVTPISSSASSTAPATLTVSVTPTSPTVLAPGPPYTATILVGGVSISVSLVVSNNPFLTITSQQLAFNGGFGGTAPAVQGVTIGSTGAALVYNAAATSDTGWLTVSPATGTTGTASAALSVGVSQTVMSTLPIGSYTGTVTITPANGDPYSIKIPVTLTVGATSQLIAAPSSLVFTYQVGQAQPPAETVELLATGLNVGFTVTTTVGNAAGCGTANWLSAVAQQNPLTTPNILIASVNTAGITAPTCAGTIHLGYDGPSGPTEVDIPVTMMVSNSALLSISLPQGFGLATTTLLTNGSGVIQSQIAIASTDGTTALAYSVDFSSTPCGWLTAGPTTGGRNGTAPTPIQVQITPGCITAPGTYMGSITISSANGLPIPVTFNIMLIVTSNVSVSVTPQGLTFNQPQGAPPPAAQSLTFTASGGAANFVATAQSDFGWLSVTPTSGSTGLGGISAVVGTNTLPQGKYSGVITITFQNAETPSATIQVQLIVGPAQNLTASVPSLTFNYQLTGAAPASQPVTLTSVGGAVAFNVGTTSNGGWLNVDTATGTTGSTGSKVINVSIDPTKIPSGTAAGAQLTGSLSISAAGVLANPITIPVTLNVTSAPTPQPVTISTSAVSNGPGAIAPGELIAIHGTSLGPLSPAAGTSFTVKSDGTVSSTLAGVQVLFDTIPGTPTFVSPTQINVIVPWEIAGRTTTNMVVMVNGIPSTPIPLQVASVFPGIYTQNATGAGQAAAVNLSSTAASVYNGPAGGTYAGTSLATAPAPQGSFIALFLTGGGLTSGTNTDGSVNPGVANPLKNWTPGSSVVTATIGGQPATVQYAGAAPTLITGVVQVNLQVPVGVTGSNLPVVITIDGVETQTTATVAVQ